MNEPTAAERHAAHLNPAFIRLLGTLGFGRTFVRARGAVLTDDEGNEVLDFLAGFGTFNLGHNPPRLVNRVRALLDDERPLLIHTGPQPEASSLARDLSARLPEPLQMSVFTSSGGEAVEAAMKMARACTGKARFVYCAGGFHGTGLGALSVMGEPRMRAPFEPLLSSESVPFGDLEALERALKARDVAAFVVEPIQAEGGVMLPPAGYLEAARALCHKAGALFILDEVQTGLGRTGARFYLDHAGLVPDVLVLAKSLSGGMAPLGAAVTTRAIHDRVFGSNEGFDLCSSTFAGHALGAVCGSEVLAALDDEGLPARAAELGARALERLRRALEDHPCVRAVRGQGLLIGVELGPRDKGLLARVREKVSEELLGQWVALLLLEAGVLTQPCSHAWNVVRLEPPLTVSEAELDRAVDALLEVLERCRDPLVAAKDAALRVGKQWRRGWTF